MQHGPKFHQEFFRNLSNEQRQAVRDLIREMRQAGATRQEIHKAVQKLMNEWGIEGDKGTQDLLNKNEGTLPTFAAPNPFNPNTTITYTVQEDGPVSVKVYNTQGRLIRTLYEGQSAKGTHQIVWDGRNSAGEIVSSGLYLYKVNADGKIYTERMTLMK